MKKLKCLYLRNLTETLSNALGLKKVYKLIKFIHSFWLKPYIDMNTDLNLSI